MRAVRYEPSGTTLVGERYDLAMATDAQKFDLSSVNAGNLALVATLAPRFGDAVHDGNARAPAALQFFNA